MQRKVIRQGHNTLTITLPAKWVQKNSVKPGDELSIEEKGMGLVIGNHNGKSNDRVEIDVSDLDSQSLRRQIRSAYKLGYDEVKVNFSNDQTIEFKSNKPQKTLDAIYKEESMLVGMEIIEQGRQYCLLKDVSNSTMNDPSPILRRVFLLLDDSFQDLLRSIKTFDEEILRTLDNKHDTVTKFITYYHRLLNKQGHSDYRKTAVLYLFINGLDMVADIIKYVGRDWLISKEKKPKKAFLDLLDLVYKDFRMFYQLYYKFDKGVIKELSKRRHEYMEYLNREGKSFTPAEIHIATEMEQILQIFFDITDSIIAMTFE